MFATHLPASYIISEGAIACALRRCRRSHAVAIEKFGVVSNEKQSLNSEMIHNFRERGAYKQINRSSYKTCVGPLQKNKGGAGA